MSVGSLWDRLEEQLVPVFADYRSRIDELPVEIKADRTLLTEADMAIQDLIVAAIRASEPDAVIIAEEDGRTGSRAEVSESRGRVWVIDPIDGTSQFVRSAKVEFCSAVCLLVDWEPAEAFVLAPELGAGRTPLVATANARTRTVLLGGLEARAPVSTDHVRWLSVTRSADDPAPAGRCGSSQPRVPRQDQHYVADPRPAAHRARHQFPDRASAAVLLPVLAPRPETLGRRRRAVHGLGSEPADVRRTRPPAPARASVPEPTGPTFPSTVVGRPETVAWFLDAVRP